MSTHRRHAARGLGAVRSPGVLLGAGDAGWGIGGIWGGLTGFRAARQGGALAGVTGTRWAVPGT